jgi:hypothetical protein
VRPAQLVPFLREVVVDLVAIAGQHTPIALRDCSPTSAVCKAATATTAAT